MGERWQKAKKRVENTTTLLRLVLVVGSGYLLYRKFRKEGVLDEITAGELMQAQDEVGSATRPLVANSAEPLRTANEPRALTYGNAAPDQVATATALQTPKPTQISPEELATAAIQSGATKAQSWLTSMLSTA